MSRGDLFETAVITFVAALTAGTVVAIMEYLIHG